MIHELKQRTDLPISHYILPKIYNKITKLYHVKKYKWHNHYINSVNINICDEFKFIKLNNNTLISCNCLHKSDNLFILNIKLHIFFNNNLVNLSNVQNLNILKCSQVTHIQNYINNYMHGNIGGINPYEYVEFNFKLIENNKIITILDNQNNLVPIIEGVEGVEGIDGVDNTDGSRSNTDHKSFYIMTLPPYPKIELKLLDIVKLFIVVIQ